MRYLMCLVCIEAKHNVNNRFKTLDAVGIHMGMALNVNSYSSQVWNPLFTLRMHTKPSK